MYSFGSVVDVRSGAHFRGWLGLFGGFCAGILREYDAFGREDFYGPGDGLIHVPGWVFGVLVLDASDL